MDTATKPADLARQLNAVRLRIEKKLDEYLAGEFSALHSGRGVEWVRLREYNPDRHELQDINWPRSSPDEDYLVANEYRRRRSLGCWLGGDLSSSMDFGFDETDNKLTAQLEAMMVFGLLLARRGNRLGALLMHGNVVEVIRTRRETLQASRIWARTAKFQVDEGVSVGPAEALRRFRGLQRTRGLIVPISDWQADDGWPDELRITARRHTVLPVHVIHSLELELPYEEFDLQDPETGDWMTLEGWNEETQKDFRSEVEAQQIGIKDGFAQAGVKPFVVTAGQDTVRQLLVQLKHRIDTRRW